MAPNSVSLWRAFALVGTGAILCTALPVYDEVDSGLGLEPAEIAAMQDKVTTGGLTEDDIPTDYGHGGSDEDVDDEWNPDPEEVEAILNRFSAIDLAEGDIPTGSADSGSEDTDDDWNPDPEEIEAILNKFSAIDLAEGDIPTGSAHSGSEGTDDGVSTEAEKVAALKNKLPPGDSIEDDVLRDYIRWDTSDVEDDWEDSGLSALDFFATNDKATAGGVTEDDTATSSGRSVDDERIRVDRGADDRHDSNLTASDLGAITKRSGTPKPAMPATDKHFTLDAFITLINATPYVWRRGYIHSYQLRRWTKDWPESIRPGESATVLAEARGGSEPKDSAGEVTYHLEGTSDPMSFMVEFQPVPTRSKGVQNQPHHIRVRYLEELETLNNGRFSVHNLGAPKQPDGVGFVLAGSEGDFVANDPPLAWMQSQLSNIGDLTLRELTLPRSHHAGMYKMTQGIGAGNAANAQTQDVNLYDQLGNGGVRVLDVRPFKAEGGEFRESHGSLIMGVWHGGLGASLDEMVDTTNRFQDDHPGELIIWDLHSTYPYDGDSTDNDPEFGPFDTGDLEKLYGTLKRLKYRTSVPDGVDVSYWSLNGFIEDGKSAVLVRVHDSWLRKGAFPGGYEGFVTSDNFPIMHRWTDTMDLDEMVADQQEGLALSRTSRLMPVYSMDWLLTQKGAEAFWPDTSLRHMARSTWAALYSGVWEASTDHTYPNWIAMDAIRGNEHKALAMAINHCLGARRCGRLGGKVKGEDWDGH